MSANDQSLHPGLALDSTVQLVWADLLDSVRRKKDAKHAAHDQLSVSDMK